MPRGLISPRVDERIAQEAARLSNQRAHHLILDRVLEAGAAPGPAQVHRQRIWQRRRAILAANPALAERVRAATKAEKATLRAAAEAIEAGSLSQANFSDRTWTDAHGVTRSNSVFTNSEYAGLAGERDPERPGDF